MSKQVFKHQCKRLQIEGWWVLTYDLERLYAVYTNGYAIATLGESK